MTESGESAVLRTSPTVAPDVLATPVRVLSKIDALDGLRGVAVILVVLNHLPLAVPSLSDRLVRGGEFGVDAFFVLSGFLITALMLRDQGARGGVRIRAFYRRRAMRILPALIVFLAVYELYAVTTHLPTLHSHAHPSTLSRVVNDIFYPWRLLASSTGTSHLWSLAVEEQFYLIWPLCVALFLGIRRSTTTVTLVLVAAIVAVAVHRAVLWYHGVFWAILYTRLDTRADALLVGCLLAHLWVRDKLPKRGLQIPAWLALAVYLYIVAVGASRAFLYWGGFTVIAIGVGVIIAAVLESPWPVTRLLRLRLLQAVGRVSYGLYIWHMAVFTAVGRYGKTWPHATQLVVALTVAAFATCASRIIIELPFLRWKERLEHPNRSAAKPPRPGEPPPAPRTSERRNFRHVAVPVPK
jgi:peptidoglycan/LPS O-acetylase OafA/YrhL